MKHRIYSLLMVGALMLFALGATAQSVMVNLTPKPYFTTKGSGSLEVPYTFAIATNDVADSVVAEAEFFANEIGHGMTVNVEEQDGAALIQLAYSPDYADEAYKLDITTSGITLEATTTAGFFYGLQSIRKMLIKSGESYYLPEVSITDKPRFGYRGFMLDCARHFFNAEEVKKFIDVMAMYKLNRLHWHLTDDQGWRIPIDKYPKLTTVGATASNCYVTDLDYGNYWTNAQYGPFFYTKDEIKEVVAYAKERHVEIIPEVDMPGHFVAAMSSYPEYSCTPNGTHTVWIWGGISTDVLNVANDEAVQFAKDICDEVMELFPYGMMHIGGDECPTTAWESNAACKALYNQLGYSSYRQLQSRFIKQMGDYINGKGYRLGLWNESITASGADLDSVQATNATIYSWYPCQQGMTTAESLGLDHICCAYTQYYINRAQGGNKWESSLPGGSSPITLKTTYTYTVPSVADHTIGVQGTFWTEHVADTAMLEYLALPRLMAVAESGWTMQNNKGYDDFINRISNDTTYLQERGIGYCATALNTQVPDPTEGQYYRLITKATDTRANRCIELLSDTSSLVETYSAKYAAENVLWTNDQAASTAGNYDYQFWTFEADPDGSGLYAMVCKAKPNGSVNPAATANSTAGRWTYDESAKHYNFTLGAGGKGASGTNFYYTIQSNQYPKKYMNAALVAQGFAVNLYSDPSDGSAGYWIFEPVSEESKESYDTSSYLEKGSVYRICNSVMDSIWLYFAKADSYLRYVPDTLGTDLYTQWKVAYSSIGDDQRQIVKLYNLGAKRAIYNNDTQGNGKIAYPVTMSATAGTITLTYQPETDDYILTLNDRDLYPVPITSAVLPGIVSSGAVLQSNPIRLQGNAWRFELVEEETGINDITLDTDADARIYDLQGRQRTRLESGVNIVNGRKVLRP